MSGPFKITVLLLALGVFTLGASTAGAQQNERRNNGRPPANAQNGQRRARTGDWLRTNRGKSFDQQKRELENDPDYKNLTPEGQQRVQQQLQRFHDLPPAQQDRLLHRLDTFNRMSPQQRAQARALWDRMRLLPEERRMAIRQYFHSLVGMNHDQRQKALTSPQFSNQFNPDEREIIQRGLELNDQNAGSGVEPPR